ncbi:serine hydrolase domain-containing protein [Pseudoalteromonas sp. T1lg65]|uniref:serine hydrolase domain-containing protein n=1 Tax=Pseudoalteromonas sp. T1lg65 TaxID=2077101 RepID=UPI003F7B0E4B
MHRIKTLSILAAIFPLFVLTACSSDEKLDFDTFVEQKLTDLREEEGAEVVSIAIVGGERTYQKHIGQLPNGAKPNNDTVYEIASITKTYIGLLLAKAIADKKLSLDEDIRAYIGKDNYQNLQYANTPITLRHLATHRSGIPKEFAFTQQDIQDGRALELLSNYSKAKLFEDLSQYKLTEKPGEDFLYSNVGTRLVGHILEQTYDLPLEALVAKFITEKSGQKDTQFRHTSEQASSIVIGKNQQGDPTPLLSLYSSAEGGLTSTTSSISNYMRYLLNSSATEVTLSHTLLDGSASSHGYAYFWYTYDYDSDQPMLYNSGGSIGTSSWLSLYPKQKVGIFIVTNVAAGNTQGKLNDIANEIFDKYLEATQSKQQTM